MEKENNKLSERQKMVGELLQNKRDSIDQLTLSIDNYNQILEYVKTPGLLHHLNGLVAWIIRFVASILGLMFLLTALFLFCANFWPQDWWNQILTDNIVGNDPVDEMRLGAIVVFAFFGIIALVVGGLLLVLSNLIGSIRHRSKMIRELSKVINDMLTDQNSYLESEKNAYLNLSKELDNWT